MDSKLIRIACVAVFLFIGNGCGVYTMSGISIDYAQTKTISIQNFYNDISRGPANISQLFTNQVRDYYQQNTNLSLTESNGDLQIEGGITGYRTAPVAPQSSQNEFDQAAQTRLTLTVTVTYYNTKDDTYNFENRQFSFFKDFDNSQNLTSVENQLIDEIFEQIILDIFTASVANW